MKVKYLLLSMLLIFVGIGGIVLFCDEAHEITEEAAPATEQGYTLFIGNEPGAEGEAFYHEHMSILDAQQLRLSDNSFCAKTLAELVGEREYDRVVIDLGGEGELGELIDAYWSLVILLIRTQPQADIVLCGTERMELNGAMQDMADGHRVFYVRSRGDTYGI